MSHHLLPRFRELDRGELRHHHATVAAQAILATGERLPSADSQLYDLERDPRGEYRAIPVMGATRVLAVIPGTMPGDGLA